VIWGYDCDFEKRGKSNRLWYRCHVCMLSLIFAAVREFIDGAENKMMPLISILIRNVLLIGTHRYLSQNRNAKWVSSKEGVKRK
jgi:uncharacterized membrane protein